MTRQYADVTTRIKSAVRRFERAIDLKSLGLRVDHAFLASYKDEDHLVLADTESSWQYQHAKIRWFLPACTRLSDRDILETVIHEYVHVLHASLEKLLPEEHQTHDQLEFATELTARAMVRLFGDWR